MSDNKDKVVHKTSIGGQALIEGVMMRGVEKYAVAVRKPDGEIIVDQKDIISSKSIWYRLPIVRGVFRFVESLVTGTKCLMYSAEFFDIEEEEPSKFDDFLNRVFGDKLKNVIIYVSVALAIVFSVLLFFMLPVFITSWFTKTFDNYTLKSLIEGVVRILILLGYMFGVSRMKDIQRVFEYHGAEHKSIFCYEKGLPLTVENVKKQKRFHPRCGTSFLLIVMVIAIIFFSFIHTDHAVLRIVYRLLLLPVVAGVSYEIIKLAGRYENWLTRMISAPGMWLQRITTREPDEEQIEVALAALTSVLPENKEDDKW